MDQISSSFCLLQLYQRLPADVKGHSLRVSLVMEMITDEMLKESCGIPKRFGLETRDDMLRFAWEAGFYHDIGKIKVPQALLIKQGPLTDAELKKIRGHTLYAAELLEPCIKKLGVSEQPYYRAILEICVCHHERWDGGGYPRGLAGENIPLFARVCAVADSFDAMVSKRYYSKAKSHAAAAEEIARCSGSQFDPQVAEAFLRISPEVCTLLTRKGWEAKTGTIK
jgi:HD-GYP domain-containing protein (c-di-GMP phosphodiesterase class II)